MKPESQSLLFLLRRCAVVAGLCLMAVACSQDPAPKGKVAAAGESKVSEQAAALPSRAESVSASDAPSEPAAPTKQAAPKPKQTARTSVTPVSDKSTSQQSTAKPSADKRKPSGKNKADKKKSSVKKEASGKKKVSDKKADKKKSPTKKKASGKKKAGKKKAKKQTWADKHFVALKTNVLTDVMLLPSLGFEIELHPHITLDFPVMMNFVDLTDEHALRTIAFQPEARWWLKTAREGGHFFGVHTHVAWYNLKWNERRYQGGKRPLAGVGVSYGYRLPFNRHWAAEANIGFGYANMEYDTYYNIDNGAYIDTRLRNYWGLTRAGVSLIYRF